MLRIIETEAAGELIARKAVRLSEAEPVVGPILEDIRRRGDVALLEYARKFDGFDGDSVIVSPTYTADASAEFLSALEVAACNIREYAKLQLPRESYVDLPDGRRLGHIVRPLDSMGAYIPAGRYPLPSTLLMTVIPAQVAGVSNICVACPHPSPEILSTFQFCGAGRMFQMGGAQAIGAFAFGTETVPKVDRIVGPDNIYVAAAKKLLAGEVGIDFVAGPTEIVIIAEEGDARHIAADMLAQAEHDTEASSILLTTSRKLAECVAAEAHRQLEILPTASVAGEAIRNNSAIIIVSSIFEAFDLANRLAPEHLVIPDKSFLSAVHNAGSVFIGPYSPEAAGDYASGPNHVLPTSGAARIRGGLSSADFVKVISVQELTPGALERLAPAITTLARAEGLEAHARSIEVRLGKS